MRYLKIIILPFLFSTVFCFAQTTDKSLLTKLFDNFPIDSSLNFITNYCKTNNYISEPNIYDKTKTDYSSKIQNKTFFDYKPTSISISSSYVYKYPLGDTIPESEEALVILLTLSYQDNAIFNAKKQYKRLIKIFRKNYHHSGKTYIFSEHGREGEMVRFYIEKNSKLPLLSIELKYRRKETTLWQAQSILIAYVRSYPMIENN